MKKFLAEFRDFALKGYAVNVAVGVIIGGAFQSIITSFVNDIISPLLGMTSELEFSELIIKIGAANVHIGAFINSIINFIIMALLVFVLIRGMIKVSSISTLRPDPTTRICPYCLSEIPIEASKCAYCTSDVPEYKQEESLQDSKEDINRLRLSLTSKLTKLKRKDKTKDN